MKLNHLDIQVPNVPEAAAFFERHFDFRIVTNPSSPALIALTDSAGFVLVLQRLKDQAQKYPDGFHLGFYVAEASLVHEHRAQLVGAGVRVGEIIENNRGVMFYFNGPGGVLIEVNAPKPMKRPPSRMIAARYL